MYLQNINEFQKLLHWEAPGRTHEKRRAELSEVEGRYFPGHYASINEVYYGVRPGTDGPVLIAGTQEVPLRLGRHSATVQRTENYVQARIFDGQQLVLEVDYVPDPVLEFDPYEGTYQGIFDWLVQQLPLAEFYERLTASEPS